MIRFANDKDFSRIAEIWHEAFGDSIDDVRKFFEIYKNSMAVYEKNGEIIGIETLLPVTIGKKRGAYVYAVAVDKQNRNSGTGKKLIEFAKENCGDFCVLVPADSGLFSYYAKLGFETVNCIKKQSFDSVECRTLPEEISAEEYFEIREEYFYDTEYVKWSINDLENIRKMYDGSFLKLGNSAVFCTGSKDELKAAEVIGDSAEIIHSACAYFNCKKISAVLKGKEPFAMIYPPEYKNVYFNIALD